MNNLTDLFKNINIDLTREQVSQFNCYTRLLLTYNEKINLTAIVNEDDINLKHYYDSCIPLATGYFNDDLSVIDIGSGAGFPAIPMKIIKPSLDFTLVDSLNKRIDFLNALISELNLDKIKTMNKRAEDAAHLDALREKFDISVARAVAPLNVLIEYCIPFVKVGGYFIALKGKGAGEEIETSKRAMDILGAKLMEVAEFPLSYTDIVRNIVIIKKLESTKPKYPRKAGKPTKSPL